MNKNFTASSLFILFTFLLFFSSFKTEDVPDFGRRIRCVADMTLLVLDPSSDPDSIYKQGTYTPGVFCESDSIVEGPDLNDDGIPDFDTITTFCPLEVICNDGICDPIGVSLSDLCDAPECIICPVDSNGKNFIDTISVLIPSIGSSGGQPVVTNDTFIFVVEKQLIVRPEEGQIFESYTYEIPDPKIFNFPERFQTCNTELDSSDILTEITNVGELFGTAVCVNYTIAPLQIATTKPFDGCSETFLKSQQAIISIDLGGAFPDEDSSMVSFPCFEVREKVNIGDFTPPYFTEVPPDQTIECGAFNERDYRAKAKDNCTPYVYVGHGCPSFTDPNGNIIHTFLWKAEDRCGNVAGAQTRITELCSVPNPPTPPTPLNCDAVGITPTANRITVTNLSSPQKDVKVYRVKSNGGWELADRCNNGNCQETEVFDNLNEGLYVVEVHLFDENWRTICTFRKRDFQVSGSGGENPTPPNPNPPNPTPTPPTGDCDDITYETSTNKLVINNLNAPIIDLKVFNQGWQQVYACTQEECSETVTLNDLTSRVYHTIIKLYDLKDNGGWEEICQRRDRIEMPNAGGSRAGEGTNFELYPNPAEHEVYLDMWEYMGKSATIRIYNAMSKEVFVQSFDQVTNDRIRIDLRDFTNGMHIISIKAEGHQAVAKKLMVARLY